MRFESFASESALSRAFIVPAFAPASESAFFRSFSWSVAPIPPRALIIFFRESESAPSSPIVPRASESSLSATLFASFPPAPPAPPVPPAAESFFCSSLILSSMTESMLSILAAPARSLLSRHESFSFKRSFFSSTRASRSDFNESSPFFIASARSRSHFRWAFSEFTALEWKASSATPFIRSFVQFILSSVYFSPSAGVCLSVFSLMKN